MPKYRDGRARGLTFPNGAFVSPVKTSVSLEDPFWKALHEIAATKGVPAFDLVYMINKKRRGNSLSSAMRLFVLEYYRG